MPARRSTRAALGAALLGLALIAPPAAAAFPASPSVPGVLARAREWGDVGPWRLRDSPEQPGAWCGYGPGDEGFDRVLVQVRPPVLRARDVTPGRDHQRVAWRAVLVLPPDASWPDDAIVTPLVSRVAWDDTPARFEPVLIPTNGLDDLTVRIRLWWYGPDGVTAEGWARADVENYLITVWDRSVWEYCPGWGILG